MRPDLPLEDVLALPRCSARSTALDEPVLGTASTVRAWLLLEQPGPWGRDALPDSRLPDGLGGQLDALCKRLGIKALLIRRTGRGATSNRPHCLLARTDPGRAWVGQVRLPWPEAVLDLDLAALARGAAAQPADLGLEPAAEPVFLVCTHGRHDPCCAEQGRPVAAALAERFVQGTWECSHVGGDRFAANVVALPHGIYFGRLGPEEALAAAQGYAAGSLDLAHLRGRSCYPFPVQAAEVYLRRDQGLLGVDDLRLQHTGRRGDEVAARFADRSGRAFLVRVRTGTADPARRLSCHDAAASRPPAYELVEVAKES